MEGEGGAAPSTLGEKGECVAPNEGGGPHGFA
jgi:hypothetical protein